MPRGRLYDQDYRLKLSGHETFPLRYGWLKKAFDAVQEEERAGGGRSVFRAEDAIARFGVGRNMVQSIRHWAVAAGVIKENCLKTTNLGLFLFNNGTGIDPWMEDPATSWLVHWNLCGDPRHTTWYWAFSHFPSPTFERATLAEAIANFAREHHPKARAAFNTIKSDVACFVRTYAGQPPSAGAGHEDSLESPLTELGLIAPTGRREGFRFVRGRKPTLGPGLVAYAAHQFWQKRAEAGPGATTAGTTATAGTLSFEALAHEPGSPGRVFCLDENALAEHLLVIGEVSDGAYRWSETAGLKQLIRARELREDEEWGLIRRDAGRGLRRRAA